MGDIRKKSKIEVAKSGELGFLELISNPLGQGHASSKIRLAATMGHANREQ